MNYVPNTICDKALVSLGKETMKGRRTVLEGLVAFAIGALLCFLLLGKVAFAVIHYLSHMTKFILIVAG